MKNYVVYHLHDEVSLLDSCTNFKLYVDEAVKNNQKAIAFSNHGKINNWVEKKIYCDKNNIKYIHGVEIYLTEKLSWWNEEKDCYEKRRDNFHTILLAKNYEGVKEINTLIDLSTQPDHMYYKNRISFDEFLNISDNVIKISACLASPLARLAAEDVYYKKLALHYDYYEIQPHDHIDQVKFNQKLLDMSKRYNKPLIAGTDTHSINKYKAECRSILQKAKGIEYEDEDSFDLTFKTYEDLVGMFKKQNSLADEIYLKAIENTNEMADSVEEFKLDFSFKYPKLYEDEENKFKELINKKYKEKLDNRIIKKNKRYLTDIKEEFRVFKKLGMLGFMLFMSELITWCKENNIPTCPCRGSVGGSTIAYITDVTDVDPIVWNTVFSRFCNEDRLEIGDIDCDFAPNDREKVYNYIIERFGIDKTSYILATGTISDKGTIDEIGRALGYDWTKKHKEELERKILKETDNPYHISKMEGIKKEYVENPDKARENYSELFYYFDGLLNTAISQSMHPAGMIASPITLTDNYGTFWNDGKRILCINMEEVHEVSLVKYDILGLKNIGIIKNTCELIQQKYPLAHTINWNDENVWKDIATSPVGIFQFESNFAFKLLEKYKPNKLNDLSLINASLRPSGESYRERLINREANKNPSEQIDELLKDNNGYLVFQEDTIKFLKDICGLSGSEADNIRRAIGRKQKERLEKALPQILEGYCNKSDKPREIAEKEAKEFLQIIEDSSNYQFGLNHSTGYSMIGYLCGYYRYHEPLAFITSYLNNANNEEDIKSGTELAKLKNIEIKPIKFRYSKAEYMFDKETNSIYKGISSVKFLNDTIANDLYDLRNNQYSSFIELIFDIKEQTSVNTKQLDILIKLDFFSEFGKVKKLLKLVEYYDVIGGKKQLKKDKVDQLNIPIEIIKQYSSETEKQFNKIEDKNILLEIEKITLNEDLTTKEYLDNQREILGMVAYIDKSYTNKIYYISEVEIMKTITKIKLYRIKDGVSQDVKMWTNNFNKDQICSGDIVYIDKSDVDKKPQKVATNEVNPDTGKKIYKDVEGSFEYWLKNYRIITDQF